MNKKCPICNHYITKKQDHMFKDMGKGMQRVHTTCAENAELDFARMEREAKEMTLSDMLHLVKDIKTR